jgi:hypothetical protein
MLAGNSALRNYTKSEEQDAISWVCLGPGGETHYIPNKNCRDGLRAQVFFPSCWDGKNVDSADHKSHVSYPLGAFNSGKCPPSHPVRLMSLFYEVIWSINDFADKWYSPNHPFVLSSGDTTGYGYHGDFLNGWDTAILQKAIGNCTNMGGLVKDCQIFDLHTDAEMAACSRKSDFPEIVTGTLAKLPGCNPIAGQPTPAGC